MINRYQGALLLTLLFVLNSCKTSSDQICSESLVDTFNSKVIILSEKNDIRPLTLYKQAEEHFIDIGLLESKSKESYLQTITNILNTDVIIPIDSMNTVIPYVTDIGRSANLGAVATIFDYLEEDCKSFFAENDLGKISERLLLLTFSRAPREQLSLEYEKLFDQINGRDFQENIMLRAYFTGLIYSALEYTYLNFDG